MQGGPLNMMNMMGMPGMPGAAPRKVRSKISNDRKTGRIVEWKSNFGWIQPDSVINHPEAAMHRGKVYLGEKDIEAEIKDVGAHVSFFVYADGTGLGAMNCRPAGTEGAPATAPISKPTVLGPGAGVGLHGVGGPKAPGVPPPRPGMMGSGGITPGQPQPPLRTGKRERLSDEPIKGSVKSWKGTFGWITPLEQISHPLFKGDVYVTQKDIDGGEEMGQGMDVFFFVYADAQGLGAENCTVVAPESIEIRQKTAKMPGMTDPGLLRAKPKAKASIPNGMDPEIASRLNAWMWDQGG